MPGKPGNAADLLRGRPKEIIALAERLRMLRLLFEHGMRLPGAENVLPEARSQVRWIELRAGDIVPDKDLTRLLILASRR